MAFSLPYDQFDALARLSDSTFQPFTSGTPVLAKSSSSSSDLFGHLVVSHGFPSPRFVLFHVDDVFHSFSGGVPLSPTPVPTAALAASARAVLSLDDHGCVSFVLKAFCSRCSLLVAPETHSSRCVVKDLFADERRADSRAVAWIGDALLLLDCRVCILLAGTPLSLTQQQLSRYVDNESLARHYDEFSRSCSPRFPTFGPSVKQRATAFEASYASDFRSQFLRAVFGRSPDEVDRCMASFLAGEVRTIDAFKRYLSS